MVKVNLQRRAGIASIVAVGLSLAVNIAWAQTNTVDIGFAAPLTGSVANYGKDLQMGVQLAIEEANAQKIVIAGKPTQFRLIVKDDQADPRLAVQAAQSLIDAKVTAVVGHLTSGASIPASGLYDKAGIPMIVPSASNPTITQQGYKNVFRVYGTDKTIAARAADYAVDVRKAKRIVIVDDRTAFGQGLAEELEKSLKARGVTPVSHEFTSDQAMDFRAILTNVRNARGDLLFFAGLGGQGATFVKQARQTGYKGTLMAGVTFANKKFLETAGPAAEDMVALEHGGPLEKLPGGKEFQDKFRKRFDADVVGYSPFGYNATWTLINAMKKAESTDAKVFTPVIAKLNFDGLLGQISFDDKGDLKEPKATVYEVKNGAWVAVYTK